MGGIIESCKSTISPTQTHLYSSSTHPTQDHFPTNDYNYNQKDTDKELSKGPPNPD